jgi:hypothetical protein
MKERNKVRLLFGLLVFTTGCTLLHGCNYNSLLNPKYTLKETGFLHLFFSTG